MNQIATNVEQSNKLFELIDPSSADMYYTPLNGMEYPWVWKGKPLLEKGGVPAWSLTALFSILPKGTRLIKSTNGMYSVDSPYSSAAPQWYENPIDAAFEMLVKLKEKEL